jgi:hypothetical protein
MLVTVEGSVSLLVISGDTAFLHKVSSLKSYSNSKHEGAYPNVRVYSDTIQQNVFVP